MHKREWAARDVTQPQTGFFKLRLVRNGPHVAAKIRCIRGDWSAVVNGETFASSPDPAAAPMVFNVWLGAEEITEAEYESLLDQARSAPPGDPLRDPKKPIVLTDLPPIF